ncbi:MAG: hypothetical protein LBT22_09145 [Peptococcaceae bacterium]|jgi:uncharacterized coiled-coil DUF342 family protein|nr:hypothetical protein [Peptococcaceae bacterium]
MNDKELLEAIGQMIAKELEPVRTDVKELKEDVKGLHVEVKELSEDVKGLQEDVGELHEEVQSVKGITLRMEQDHGKKLTALFDGYTANYEIIERYDPRVTRLERAVEKLNFELEYLKSAKS